MNPSAEGGSHPDPGDMEGGLWGGGGGLKEIGLLIGKTVQTNNTEIVLYNHLTWHTAN